MKNNMDKQKIGILTVHKNTNYGANLQAFASCLYINKLGYDCSLIDYASLDQQKSTHLFSWLKQSWDGEKNKSFSRKIKLGIALALSAPWKSKRLKNFDRFRKGYIKLTSPCNNVKDISSLGLDVIVCGSDQIWNPDIMGGIKPLYFGDVPGIKTKISYAASVGKEKYAKEDEVKAATLIQKLDHASVREEDTANYLSAVTGKDMKTVCDPVFLLDKEDYTKLIPKRQIKQEYVLLYSVISNENLTAIAKEYAAKHGLKLIEICSSKDRRASHKQIASYGPLEFLSAIKYAKTVFTNSFHGTAFSIIFEKDFYAYNNKARGSRITNILQKAGLEDRMISANVDDNFSPINYNEVEPRLKPYVDCSKEFIKQALQTQKEYLAGNSCVSCGACKAVCKFDAIKLIENKEGFITSVLDTAKCVNCGLCHKVCPALNTVEKNAEKESVYAFKASKTIREKSASGGAFTAIANGILKTGAVVYGASMDENFTVKHVRCETADNLSKIQGTKYLPSDVSTCYSCIENDLKQGKTVLFSGTPCLVDGIKRYAKLKNLPTDNLYTIDIICHGVPSKTIFDEYKRWLEKEYKGSVKEYAFRSKKISWRGSSCYAKLDDGRELKNDKRLCGFMNLYYSGNITRESCYTCPYATKGRVGDITVSDFWGIENVDKSFEDGLGVSMVILNTQKGEQLFTQTEGEKLACTIDKAKQPQLNAPPKRPISKDGFWTEYQNKGLTFVLKKHGGVKPDSLKTILYKIKNKILK